MTEYNVVLKLVHFGGENNFNPRPRKKGSWHLSIPLMVLFFKIFHEHPALFMWESSPPPLGTIVDEFAEESRGTTAE